MAVSYLWPVGLPQCPKKDGYAEDYGLRINRVQPDAGPAKMRTLGVRPDTLTVSFDMTNAQIATLRDFINNTIKGTARFGFPHPRTGLQAEVALVPQDGGKLFSISYFAFEVYTISLTLEILP